MKARASFLSAPPDGAASRISVLVLLSHCPLTERYQKQLQALARAETVQELILLSKQLPDQLSPHLKKEPKLRHLQLHSDSLSLMAEAGVFEACADVLLILKQDVSLSAPDLQAIIEPEAEGYGFGGLIRKRNSCWAGFLKMATVHCKGLFWFRLSQGYFVSRKVYHQSGGFKHNGRLRSFFELLCRQQKLSSYTFIIY
jgi:hypothetical protein